MNQDPPTHWGWFLSSEIFIEYISDTMDNFFIAMRKHGCSHEINMENRIWVNIASFLHNADAKMYLHVMGIK